MHPDLKYCGSVTTLRTNWYLAEEHFQDLGKFGGLQPSGLCAHQQAGDVIVASGFLGSLNQLC